ncbi:hypothetical protein D3C85_1016110 [compost metagenome]
MVLLIIRTEQLPMEPAPAEPVLLMDRVLMVKCFSNTIRLRKPPVKPELPGYPIKTKSETFLAQAKT